jgi:hypothetical protein
MATEPDEPQRLQYATVVDKQFEHLNSMMHETLAFARGERELLIRKVYLQKFASETEAYLRQEFKKSPVRLSVVPRYTGPARFDEGKLRRVVFNLAPGMRWRPCHRRQFPLQHRPRSGRPGPALRGQRPPGPPREIADHLFHPSPPPAAGDGAGGSSIVKRIADEHLAAR